MILSLKIENFRSIKESLTVDFRATKRLSETHLPENTFIEGDIEVLKSLMIYGRNASGKSNILLALDTIVDIVKNSDKFKFKESITQFDPFLFDANSRNEPVKFKIEFITEAKVHYLYYISYDRTKIIEESLYFYPFGKIAKLYERVNGEFSYGEHYKGVKKRIEDDLLSNQLFLSKSASSQVKYLNDAYLFLSEDILTSIFDDSESDIYWGNVFARLIIKDNELKENFLQLLRAADTNIHDFKIIDNQEVITIHPKFENGKQNGEQAIPLGQESLGTKKLFAIGGTIVDVLTHGLVLIIDELDKGFHPLLSKMIIELFNSKKNNPKNAQLIFATHDSALLDLDILRRDQIGFVDKEYEGNSIFYKLSDIKGVRKDTPIDKWYLSGRFGAIPVLGDVNFNYSK